MYDKPTNAKKFNEKRPYTFALIATLCLYRNVQC